MTKNELETLARHVATADAALTAATAGRGVDSHFAPLPDLGGNLAGALDRIERAAELVRALRGAGRLPMVSARPRGRGVEVPTVKA